MREDGCTMKSSKFKEPNNFIHACISFSTNLRSEKVVGDNVRHLGRVGGGRVQVVLVGGRERVDGVSPDHCRQGQGGVGSKTHKNEKEINGGQYAHELWADNSH